MRLQFSKAQCLPAFLAVLILVIANASHIHLRICLDGAENPVSFHFENEEMHSSHLGSADDFAKNDTADIESELSLSSLLAKFSETPTDYTVVFLFMLPELSEASKSPIESVRRKILPDDPDTLLSSSRAPPAKA